MGLRCHCDCRQGESPGCASEGKLGGWPRTAGFGGMAARLSWKSRAHRKPKKFRLWDIGSAAGTRRMQWPTPLGIEIPGQPARERGQKRKKRLAEGKKAIPCGPRRKAGTQIQLGRRPELGCRRWAGGFCFVPVVCPVRAVPHEVLSLPLIFETRWRGNRPTKRQCSPRRAQ